MNIKLEHVMNQLWISEQNKNCNQTEVSTYLVLTCTYLYLFVMCRNSVGVLKAMLEKKT